MQLNGLPSVTEGCRVSTSSHYVGQCVSLCILFLVYGCVVVSPVFPLVCSIVKCYVWTYDLILASAIIMVQSYL